MKEQSNCVLWIYLEDTFQDCSGLCKQRGDMRSGLEDKNRAVGAAENASVTLPEETVGGSRLFDGWREQ